MSGYHNNYECFHLDENGREIIDHSDSIYLEDSYYDANTFPFSADEIEGYVERLNQAIENNVILLASINNEIYYAPSDVSPEAGICYVEDLGTLFTPWNGDYTGCETIAEKVEVLNRGLINRWFDNGQIPEMPETFTSLMEQLVTEKKSAMKVFTQLNTTDRSVWFEEYNGEKLQFVEPEYESTSPVDYPGKVYYCADEGETPEEVAKIMVEAMVARMMEASQGTDFVITKYRIGKQSLTDWTDIVEGLTDSCWEEYLREHRNVDEEMESYARRWIEERFQYGMYQVPLGGEMWYFYPSGYYHFEGSYLGTFEDYAETETVVDGMVPFYYQGSNPQFILVKQGDVYCMQKGTQWGIKIFEATDASVIYPEPMSVMVDGVVFKEVKEIHRADVDHDGGEELIVVQYISATDRWQVYVVKNGETIWSQGAALGVSGTRMFLYSEEGKDYLVSYSVGDGRTYRLLQFYLEPEDAENQMAVQKYKETVADYDAITIRSNGYYSYPYDGERISKYVEHVNGILSQCISLQGNEAGSAVNADGAQTGGYLEDLSEIFTPLKNYEDCQTIAEKVERLNQVKSEQWFPDGQMPEELKNLSGTLAERMAPYLGEVEERYARIDADRASWFADYNGDKLQVITKEADENRTTEIYYYRADGGETAADVAKRLVEAMYERKTVRSDASESSFVVTDYLIVDQKLKDCSIGAWDVSDAIIDDYCMNSKKRSLTDSDELNEWINLWISQRYSGDGGRTINPLPEDMWLFTPEGYCKYEGFNLATFEETLFSAYDVVDGMIPFIYQGGEGSFDYLLVKYGDVYRMQRAVDWAK